MPSRDLGSGVQACFGMRGASKVDIFMTSQKSCVGTAGSEGEGAKGFALCLPISPGIGRDIHSSLKDQHIIVERNLERLTSSPPSRVPSSLHRRPDQLARRLNSTPTLIFTCLTIACWIVSNKNPLVSETLCGVDLPEVIAGESDR